MARAVSAARVAARRPAALTGSARLIVHVVPRARASAVAGRHGDALKIRIAAPPAEGAANSELIRFLAERLGVPRAAVRVVAGHTARRKTIVIAGRESADVLATLLAP